MGLLEHLSGALLNNNISEFDNKKTSFGFGFNSNAIKENSSKEYVSNYQINEHELALYQPVRFIRKYANANVITNAIAKTRHLRRSFVLRFLISWKPANPMLRSRKI